MCEENLELFKQAVRDSLSNKLIRELNAEAFEPRMTRHSTKIIKKVYNTGCKPSEAIALYKKRKIIAILAAAAIIVSTACTTVIHRYEIKSFIVQIFDDHIELSSPNDSAGTGIIVFYTINTVPQGYILEQETESYAEVYRKWINNEKVIIFEQLPLNTGYYNIDSEEGSTDVLYYETKEIIRHSNGDEEKYIWNDGIYFFSVTVIGSSEIDFYDLFDGIAVKEEK